MKPDEFLEDHPKPQPWTDKAPKGLEPHTFFLGQGSNALQVAVASSPARPLISDVRALWKRRHGNQPSPLLLVVLHDGQASVCGPTGDQPPVYEALDAQQAERLARQALAEPNRHAAIRLLSSMLPETEQELPGVRNSGLFSAHALRIDVPSLPQWRSACTDAQKTLNVRGRELIESLGFSIERQDQSVSFLRAGDVKRAIAAFLDEDETPEADSSRFNGMSPVSYALAIAARENVPYVLLTRGPQIRLYAASTDVGVGRKGRSETFIEANLALLPDDRAGYLPLLFGANALSSGGTFEAILERSRDFAADLGTRLRDRIYTEVVPRLAEALGKRAPKRKRSQRDLDHLYQQTLVILFRLLFVAYAEDKELLPYHRNENYRRQALKTLARELAVRESTDSFDARGTSFWMRIRQLWRAVDVGDSDLGVPPYNGGLFSEDPLVNEVGAVLGTLELSNAEIGPVLEALLVDIGVDEVRGPVDFRSLSVREFGTIYEGLLESNLALAPVALAVDSDGTYVPLTRKNQAIEVAEGEVYLHDRSGARKASGSYFTKPFAVEHLLDHALQQALDEHLSRIEQHLDAGDDHKAANDFFDFRCADIAMGSGHFLVAAVDRIEASFSAFLAAHPIPGVRAELERLRSAAREALKQVGREMDVEELEDSQLLRRQVARRCIYGVDRNRIAVELARLGVWIHTFVPGLPLSFLDHNLVHGDSLTGIGSLDEASELLMVRPRETFRRGRSVDALAKSLGVPSSITGSELIYRDQVVELLGRARASLAKLALTVDASAKEIAAARKAHAAAMAAVSPARDLFDLLVTIRLGRAEPLVNVDDASIQAHKQLGDARNLTTHLQALHFPTTFPEVFLRDRSGFDCILGNPPWEEVMVDESTFWSVRFPGIRSLNAAALKREFGRLRRARPDMVTEYEAEVEAADELRELLSCGQYPQMNEGNADLYKAFCWRFWNLSAEGGAIGVVLPRTALSGAGTREWRQRILGGGAFKNTTMLLNSGGWVFDDAEPRYTIALVTVRKGASYVGAITTAGPFAGIGAFRSGLARPPATFSSEEFQTWSEAASFPLLPSPESAEVFAKLRRQGSLGSNTGTWRARPLQGDFNATSDKSLFVLDETRAPRGAWKVYKGASFNIWDSDTGQYYAWADPARVTAVLQERRLRGQRNSRSPFSEFPRDWAEDATSLPCRHPRIAFRDVARATDSRTVIAALVPPEVILTNKAPYLLWPTGDETDQAYLLGILCSVPLDWYARRFVEISLNFHILNNFPIPRPDRGDPLRAVVVRNAGRLAAASDVYSKWAAKVGVAVADVSPDERDSLIAEIDAAVSLLYGLTEPDVVHLFESFHAGWDFTDRLRAVLTHYHSLGRR